MIWIIIAAVICVYLIVKVVTLGGFDPIVYPLIIVVGFLVGMIPNIFLSNSFNEYVNCSTHTLASLQDQAGSSGSFFLGTGSQNDEPVFYFYQKDDGYYSLMRVSAKNAAVRIDNDPRRVVCSASSSNKWLSLFGAGEDQNLFLVPQGSVVSSFNLDAK